MISILKNLALASLLLLNIAGCRTVKTVPVEKVRTTVKHDTLYFNNMQYDSIYIQNDRSQEYHLFRPSRLSTEEYEQWAKNPLNPLKPSETDTLFVKDVSIEYRYRLLRDTVYRTKVEVRCDSIPYEVKVVETQEVKYIPFWGKCLAVAGVIAILLLIQYIICKFKII